MTATLFFLLLGTVAVVAVGFVFVLRGVNSEQAATIASQTTLLLRQGEIIAEHNQTITTQAARLENDEQEMAVCCRKAIQKEEENRNLRAQVEAGRHFGRLHLDNRGGHKIGRVTAIAASGQSLRLRFPAEHLEVMQKNAAHHPDEFDHDLA